MLVARAKNTGGGLASRYITPEIPEVRLLVLSLGATYTRINTVVSIRVVLMVNFEAVSFSLCQLHTAYSFQLQVRVLVRVSIGTYDRMHSVIINSVILKRAILEVVVFFVERGAKALLFVLVFIYVCRFIYLY